MEPENTVSTRLTETHGPQLNRRETFFFLHHDKMCLFDNSLTGVR